jgi:peptide-methionine (S)-S-oxide reductase
MMVEPSSRRRSVLRSLLGAPLAATAAGLAVTRSAAGRARMIPPPRVDEEDVDGEPQEAVLAGGSFWGVQGVFQHVRGVTTALCGYAGGDVASPNDEMVSSGTTGHAQAVDVYFVSREISYGHILQIFFSVVHDPTQLNRQGPEVGTQYRSAIFARGDEQERIARAYVAQLDQAHVFRAPIVTQIDRDRDFYPADDGQQDYMWLNPRDPYIVRNAQPKVADLRRLFPGRYHANPALVMARGDTRNHRP